MPGVVRDLVLLLLMCLALYCTGLDVHGITNWQEAQRVVVAREMGERLRTDPEAWIVPTHHGQAYIAKPPLVYWVTIGLARVRGGEVELFDLRLAVALAGTLGVMVTYLVGRGVLGATRAPVAGARWAAVLLATGVLYFRSSRIGELDILLVPLVVGGVGCLWLAWGSFLKRSGLLTVADWFGLRANWPAVAGTTVLATLTVLTKGPPGLLVLALAGYGAMVLWAALDEGIEAEPGATARARLLPALLGVVFGGLGAWQVHGALDVPGVVILAVMGVGLGFVVWRLLDRRRARAAWLGLAHTHPVIVLGVPVLVFWLWGHAVAQRIGPELMLSLAREQAEDNLHLFEPTSPVRNLEALVYGCGVASVVMLVAAAWWVRHRPRARAGILLTVAWVVLGYCLFSLAGKGVPRYLTPVWPGAALVAAAWLERRRGAGESGVARPGRRVLLGALCALLGIGQAWWYAQGREVYGSERSPRALMHELQLTNARRHFASMEFYTPALDYYAGEYVQPIGNVQMPAGIAGGASWTLGELAQHVRVKGPMIVLCRDVSLDASLPAPIERMRAAGLRVEPIEVPAEFRIDNMRTRVRAVQVDAR